MMAKAAKKTESTLRKLAQRRGYDIRKSRNRTIHIDNLGEYMLIDAPKNYVVVGARYNASLEEIADYLNRL